MPRRPKVNVKRVTKRTVKGYGYVRPNPGVRAIASINGRGSYKSARAEMSGLSAQERRARAKRTVRNATQTRSSTTMPRRRIIRRNAYRRPRTYAGRTSVSFTVPKARGRGTRRISFRAPAGVKKGETYKVMAKNRRRVSRRRRASAPRRRVVSNRRRKAPVRRRRVVSNRRRKAPVRRRRAPVRRRRSTTRRRVVSNRRRKAPVRRRRRVTRNKRRSPVRRRRVTRNKRRRSPVRRRRVVRNRRRRAPVRRRRVRRNKRRSPVRRRASSRRRAPVRRRRSIRRNRRSTRSRMFRRNGAIMAWVRTGGFIATGVIGHKFLTGFLKNILVGGTPKVGADPNVDSQADGTAPATGMGMLPTGMVPYAGIISGGIAAAAGVYLVTKTVKNAESRKLLAGGMVASLLHTLIVDLLRKTNPDLAQQVSGLGASDANAARLSAMYGMGASIEPMYSPIGEYFQGGMGAVPSYEAQAGMGEYFGSGVGEYFSGGMNGLGEYGSNPDMQQAAAGYGALDAGSNSNYIDPSSNLDRELSIAEAAAGVGSMGPMQAAAGLGNVHTVGASQTWIPGESDPQIWAGTRAVDRSQMSTAMIPAGSLQSGGGQGIFG